MNFETFNLHPSVMAGVRELGYSEPTPIQREAIPPIMQGRDIIGLAQTGTGKTAAFALPILERLRASQPGSVQALIISPTRELAEQICKVFDGLGRKTGIRSMAVYGGDSMERQIQCLQMKPEIVIACPGRLLDHLWRGTISLSGLKTLVIDEADRMFDMGFLADIRNILKCIMHKHQTLLFSATMPADIRRLANEVLTNPVTVQIDRQLPARTVSHCVYPVQPHLKTNLLKEILNKTRTDSVLVFTRTKHRAKRLAQQIARDGYKAAALHGDLSQGQRQTSLKGFRSGSIKILVATDIAARGIDVSSISHVINFDMPRSTDDYIHRIGRTGRVGRVGDALTLVTGEDKAMVRSLERLLNKSIEHRMLESFDYTKPAPAREGVRPMRRPRQRTRQVR